MGHYDFEHMRVETNVPPGVGAEACMASMEPWRKYNLGRSVLAFVKNCKQDPEIWAKVKAKEAELRASGFFDAHPAK